MTVPQDNPFRVRSWVLACYARYGIRWWVNLDSGEVRMLGDVEMLTPEQQQHLLVSHALLAGFPVNPGVEPKPWLEDADIADLLLLDMAGFEEEAAAQAA